MSLIARADTWNSPEAYIGGIAFLLFAYACFETSRLKRPEGAVRITPSEKRERLEKLRRLTVLKWGAICVWGALIILHQLNLI